MHKFTTLLAALALTACSINIDSQYGLRLERRIHTPQSDAPEHLAPAEVPTEVNPLALEHICDQYPTAPQVDYSLNFRVDESESLPEVQYYTASQFSAYQNLKVTDDLPVMKTEGTPSKPQKWVTAGLKVIATLFLAFATLIAALYGILILALTDWTSTVGSPGGDFIGIGTYGYPSGIFLTLLSVGGVWLGIRLIKEVWRKKAKTNKD